MSSGLSLQTSTRPTWAAWLRRGAWPLLWPLGLLNLLLTFETDGKSPWPHPTLQLSLELVVVMLALALWSVWRRPPQLARWLAIFTTVWVAAHALDVAARTLYGRPLNLYWDGGHAWGLLKLGTAGSTPVWRVALGAVALLITLALVGLGVRHLWRRLLPRLGDARARPVLIAGCAMLLAAFALREVGGHDMRRMFSRSVAPEVARQARLLANQLSSDRSAARLTPSPDFSGNLGALNGADVLLLFAGSYGMTSFDNPRQARALAPAREALLRTIAGSGSAVVSARITASAFGGSSELAQAAVLTGVDARDPFDHDVLLSTQRPTLVRHFRRHGWRTVGWMPGVHKPWPEGHFYGFDRIADLQGIGYGGTVFGHWQVPDQAAMALLQRQEFAASRAARQPVFAVFPTATGHAPFWPVAPFTPDWDRLTGAAAYSASEIAQALAEPVDGSDPVPGYLQPIGYTHRWLADYLAHRAPAGLLTIVIGDRPPRATVSGANASWEVPVHVIGNDRVLIERFVQAGFARGLTPPVERWGDMHQLTATLLDVFADGRPHDSAAAAK